MELKVSRKEFTEKSTIGEVYQDGNFLCYVLEDVDRKLEAGGVKIPKETAIPRGRYRVVFDLSTRFARPTPRLDNVPHFDGVRIHTGNTAANTEGCLLLGMVKGTDQISDSWHALGLLLSWMIQAVLHGEQVWITIE